MAERCFELWNRPAGRLSRLYSLENLEDDPQVSRSWVRRDDLTCREVWEHELAEDFEER